ncbi:hypothetical protein G3I34_29725, partial [Streptomyces sp. SID8014]|nr:hypothetical protein [Streptomyces sp. SID8014]
MTVTSTTEHTEYADHTGQAEYAEGGRDREARPQEAEKTRQAGEGAAVRAGADAAAAGGAWDDGLIARRAAAAVAAT